MNFIESIKNSNAVITEGALLERLRRDQSVSLDPNIEHAGFIYDPYAGSVLEGLFRQYMDIGQKYDLPMIFCTPTWRANPERLAKAGIGMVEQVNNDSFSFVDKIRKSYGEYSSKIFIGGLMGCKGDSYRPKEALEKNEATAFHRIQAKALADSGCDFLYAATQPAISEAVGIAAAMAECDVPYVISFLIMPDGKLLDGITLSEAIEQIDDKISPRPSFYMVNCVHPLVFKQALSKSFNETENLRSRLIGLQANSSTKSPEELENLPYLDTTEPVEFSEYMLQLHKRFGIKILGGCCGTDNRHIEEIARKLHDYQ